MAQHFLNTSQCRPLPLADAMRMSEAEAYRWFCRARWPDRGEPWCPRCGNVKVWTVRRRRYKCGAKQCRAEFSATSGTIYANRKLLGDAYMEHDEKTVSELVKKRLLLEIR